VSRISVSEAPNVPGMLRFASIGPGWRGAVLGRSVRQAVRQVGEAEVATGFARSAASREHVAMVGLVRCVRDGQPPEVCGRQALEVANLAEVCA